MSESRENRERAVQAITHRDRLRRRVERARQFMKALQGEVPQALQDSLAANQAALSEADQTVEAFKADMRQEEERIRRKVQEALRLQAELRSRQFPLFPGGSVSSSPGQSLGLIVLMAAMAAILGGVLLLNR